MTGTGTIELGGSIGGGGELTNATNTIHGPGTIDGLTFNNEATVVDDIDQTTLFIGRFGHTTTVHNSGTIKVESGAGLQIDGANIDNSGGIIETINGGGDIDINSTIVNDELWKQVMVAGSMFMMQ